jgi:hypothetical protein
MTRYYFDVLDGAEMVRDDEGLLLSNRKDVEAAAEQLAADLVRGPSLRRGEPDIKVEVRDECGKIVYTISLTGRWTG